VQHLPAARMDWRSETVRSWEERLQGSRREGETQQSRRQQREQQLWQRAQQQVEAAERLKRAEEEKELHDSLYGHRQPVNRRRALGDGQGGGLEEAAITLHNSTTMGGLRPELAAQRGDCLHNRNTAFSVPIEHSKGGAHHHHGIWVWGKGGRLLPILPFLNFSCCWYSLCIEQERKTFACCDSEESAWDAADWGRSWNGGADAIWLQRAVLLAAGCGCLQERKADSAGDSY
jgi:hypothetical protein